jgi:hypothetical protein
MNQSDIHLIRSAERKNTSASLRRRRYQAGTASDPIEHIIRGSLVETLKRCGRPSCRCADGPGHGPKRYLSTVARTGERPCGYVPNAAYPQVAEFRPTIASSRRCSTRFARSTPSFCVAAKVSTRWILPSQHSTLT